MSKKWTRGLLAGMLMLNFSPIGLAHEYEDIQVGDEGYKAVEYLNEKGVYPDTKTFRPEIYLTRANFVVDLIKLNTPDRSLLPEPHLDYLDTQNNAWYSPYFQQAIDLGILDDQPENAYPYRFVSQLEALTLLFRSKGIPIPRNYEGDIPFSDLKNNPQAGLIMKAIELDLFTPQNESTAGIYRALPRLEAAKMLYKMEQFSELDYNEPVQIVVSDSAAYDPELEKFINAWIYVQSNYLYDDYNRDAVIDEALKAMVDALGDDYSLYMDAETTQQFFSGGGGEIEGIGAVLDLNEEEEVVIVSPITGSPAEEAGVKSGDVITQVDGVDVAGLRITDVIALIKGPKGTQVTLTLKRENEILTIDIVRDLIEIKSLENEIIENGSIYYIDFAQFNSEADLEFKAVIDQFLEDPKAKGIIIDVRGNPGGFLGVTVNILSHFVDYLELVVRIQYKDNYQELLSNGEGELGGTPIVVLIDEGSASASEILAGVLQDYGLATIMGEYSFGKGTVQHIQELSDRSSIKLTVAKWITPGWQDIAGEGISPDLFVSDDPNTEIDEALDEAIKELKKQF